MLDMDELNLNKINDMKVTVSGQNVKLVCSFVQLGCINRQHRHVRENIKTSAKEIVGSLWVKAI
jgi:hypothetical protein